MSEIYSATGSGNGFISHCSRSSVKKLECPVDTISTKEKGADFQIHWEIPNVLNKEFPQSDHSATMCSLSAANAKFCLDFFRELKKRKRNENIFFSPLSLSAAFGMVVLGARGSTLEQIEKVFHFREVLSSTRQENRYPSEQCEEDEGVHSQFQALLAEVSEPGPGCCLTIANRLFGEITYPFFQQYLDSTKKFYRAELEPVNFKYTEEEVRDKINFWVENETKGKIKDLFAAGFIDPSTVLVLVNAIYFKGKWAVEFKKEDTKEAYFHLNKNERRKVQMMFQEGYFNMAIIEELKTKVLELQYFNNELSMFILLPEDDCEDFTGLEQLECALTYEKLAEWTSLSTMQPLRVKVYLPQFKMEESYVLNNTLQEMGVMNVFDWGKADLSGISMKGGLVVSKAIQKTIVEVNEEGTEAGCSTGLLVMPLCCPETCEFRADRPFLFFIRHNQTNTILFFGRYSSP